jgi:hypothetical protein
VTRWRYDAQVFQTDYAAAQLADVSIVSNRLTDDLAHAAHRGVMTRKAAARILAAYAAEKKRADRLQQRLDDALGLNNYRVQDGRMWQHTSTDKEEGAAL